MKFSPSTFVLSLAVLVPVATADFTVYYSELNGLMGSATGWSLYDGKPDCDQAAKSKVYSDESDVSGNKRGVRCKGDCGKDGFIDEMEMKFNSNAHFTFYKRPSNNLLSPDGKKLGKCYTQTDEHELRCSRGGPSYDYKRLECKTPITKKSINDASD